MNIGDSTHLIAGVFEHSTACRIVNSIRLKTKKAVDDFKVILHPVMGLLQQDLFFGERAAQTLAPLRLRKGKPRSVGIFNVRISAGALPAIERPRPGAGGSSLPP